eukprot:TRINITY_DN9554_c0_g1_i1.p1 TRINITY_DN9554_c0_g1~~TRINITY_DN9554_c0_g1_i1.p1  ORF type:complete len:344 (-),score=107.98 TRINITY_DN9554_c0_g1_i1:76-1107(-)
MADSKLGTTVNQHLARTQLEHPKATGEFTRLLSEIVVAAKIIRDKVTLAGIAEVVGATGDKNVQGEQVQILDVLSNSIMKRRLLATGLVCMMCSEEEDQPIYPEDQHALGGKYIVAMDPLDGSSNIACNIPVGTIFGIWKRKTPNTQKATVDEDLLQPGRNMVCAGYVLYGPSSMLVFTTAHDQGVHGFTYDPSIGEFILTHENIMLPAKSKCYSINEAYLSYWDKGVTGFVDWIKTPNKEEGRPYTGRYVGSLVADFHRNLLYGGVYAYPRDKREPNGKLRLLYECAPLSFICERAGGLGSTGEENILDIVPKSMHQRVPLYVGNKRDVEVAQEFVLGKRDK